MVALYWSYLPTPLARLLLLRRLRSALADAVEVIQEFAKHREMVARSFGFAADVAQDAVQGFQIILRLGGWR